MKIVFFLTQDLNSPSGLGRYFPLAKELYRLGHQVRIIALHSNYKTLKPKLQIVDGVYVNYIGQMQVLKINNEKRYFPAYKLFFIMMVSLLQFTLNALFINFDILVVGKPHPMNGIAGVIAKIIRNKTLVIDCDDYEAGSNKFQSKFQYKIVKFFEEKIPLMGDLVTTHTQFNKSRLLNLGIQENRIKIIPNGVDRERFAQVDLKEVENLREELDLTDKRVIGFIGSISLKSHPINILLEACKIIIPRYPDLIIMCVGGGEDIETVKVIAEEFGISEHLLMIGRVNPDQIAIYYKLCSMTVDPVFNNDTARGRLPLKMFESWASEVPFVTSDVGDRKLYLNNPHTGALARDDSPHSLSESIIKVLEVKTFTKEIVDNGKKVLPNYYWENIVINFMKSLNNLLR